MVPLGRAQPGDWYNRDTRSLPAVLGVAVQSLNPQQQAAVLYIDGPLLVLAGAGSGKTSVITRKIAYLVSECGYAARQVAAVTFTNKAAREMKGRVTRLLGPAGSGLQVSTFHTLGLRIIRRELSALGLRPGFSIFDETDVTGVIKEILHRAGDEAGEQLGLIRHQISTWKSELVSPDEALRLAERPLEVTMAVAYQRYQESLTAYNAVDFDDLIRLPVELLRSDAAALERWQNRIHYLLVDEYQDTNASQYALVRLLVGARGALTVVGDDDQSIYAWRGARPENLGELQRDYPRLKVIMLEQNYRSTGTILRAANQLISTNPHLFEKKLWSELGPGEPIRVWETANEEDEAERIATSIVDLCLRKRNAYSDFAVLYRGNHQSRLLELKLQHYQVPYKVSGGTSFFARGEVRDLLGYLKLMVNPDDDTAFLRVVNVPRREIGANTLRALAEYASDRRVSMMAACGELGLDTRVAARGAERLRAFASFITETARRVLSGDPRTALRQLVDDIEYADWLEKNSSSPAAAERRMANVQFLLDALLKQIDNNDSEDALEQAVGKLLLQDLLEQRNEETDDNRVQLLTLHAAKGLEFPHVFLMGMEEELLPHRSSIDADQIEEERRLAYVGITRARETLTCTLARSRKRFGETLSTTPSRFLEELPTELLEWQGRGHSDPAAEQARGRATLAGLKQLLQSS